MPPSKPVVPLKYLLKAVIIISGPALMALAVFVSLGILSFSHFLYAYSLILTASALIAHPLLSNLMSLTHYVNDLAQDKKVDTPDLRYLGAMADLTEAVDELQHSWERKKQQMESVITDREVLVDTLPDILVMISDEGRIVRTNSAARAIFGQNLAGQSLRSVIESDLLHQTVNAVIQDFRGREVEFYIDTPEPYDFRAIIKRFTGPSTAPAGSISTIITLNDITELKRVQQMRADFVANASHEIRTPLASIKGFIETLQGPAKEDPGARDEFLRIMAEQADRMTRLISDLLSLSKIEMNAHSVPTGKVDLLHLIRKEKENLARVAEAKNMTIQLELHDNLPAARGDESELTQVVHNLLGNAIKYGFADTPVQVSAKVTSNIPPEMRLQGSVLHRVIAISFRDRGEGIAKHHLPRLTERFYRVDSARTRKVGGTGLGLAIVKHILNRHQGILAIDSVLGEGSTFTVYLPVSEE